MKGGRATALHPRPRRRIPAGLGPGLAIVRSVAVAHGGSLWLQDRPGGGLSARVILPLARHHAGRRLAAWLGAACVAGLMLAGAPGDARPPASRRP